MTGAQRTSKLRKASANHRLSAFLVQIEVLESANFPHPDGRDALKKLKFEIERQLKRLARCPVTDDDLVDRLYAQARNTVRDYTPILGFILRSTNVRNAFEVHFPLKRFAKQIIGPNAKLIISSEWDFVPFTYPMSLDQLPQFALVGGPASESGNVLTMPVAGHEVGHSAWRVHAPSFALDSNLIAAVDASIALHPKEIAALIAQSGTGPLAHAQIRHSAVRHGRKQLEEIFCDAVGLNFFGASFLYAIEYFLAPGGGPRSLTYPRDAERLRLLRNSCSTLGITHSDLLFERWSDSVAHPSQREFIAIMDGAVGTLADDVISRAFALFKAKGVAVPDATRVGKAIESFARGEPAMGGTTLGEAVTAGWEIVRQRGGLADLKTRREYRDLNDLILKSVEVSEFELRLASA